MSSEPRPADRADRADRADLLAYDLRALIGRLRRRLREQTQDGDLSASQISVLMWLGKLGPTTASDLARAEAMRPQSMAPLIAALDDAGLVRGAPDPEDGRRTILSLTDAGEKWTQDRRAARQDWLSRTLRARLSAPEQDSLADALRLLERLLDE